MRQYHSCDQCRLAVLSGNTEVCAAGAMRVVIDIQNELLLELHQLDRLTDLRAFRDFAVHLNEGNDFSPRVMTFIQLLTLLKLAIHIAAEWG